ncbi:MAG TPA: hypothetical protein DIV86_07450 [Alphaproteobacteria bacterium]|nr:hypothetical protein [Alphaproteobacteria bacterium]
MRIFSSNIEAKLVDFVNTTRGSAEDYYAMHFRLSKLTESYKSDFQIKIAVNILNELFREEQGDILRADNLDIFLLYKGNDRNLVNKAIFQLRYLFFDDPLATTPDGKENKEFCEIYDINFQWQGFSVLANKIMTESIQKAIGKSDFLEQMPVISAKSLVDLEKEIEETRLDKSIRKQSICTIRDIKSPKPLFHEIYINIPSLQSQMKSNFKITGNKWLFLYITQKLDEKVIETISVNPEQFLYMPISLNLNLSTVLSPDFTEFSEIAKDFKCQIFIELSVTDIFSDISTFFKVRDICQKREHKICLDGLNNDAFIQVSRKNLGFDMAKLQWNADMKSDLELKNENRLLKEAIDNCGANRLILCRCDDIHAIEYGHALGINLFQGRYPDRILYPHNKIIN